MEEDDDEALDAVSYSTIGTVSQLTTRSDYSMTERRALAKLKKKAAIGFESPAAYAKKASRRARAQ